MLQKEIGHFSLEDRQQMHERPNFPDPILVSIIIPTFNNARFLPEALDSVFTQNFNAYELIVVDDGSTDNTQAVLASYKKELASERLRVVYQENGGSAVARNTGLGIAQGEYIVFLDADDILLPNKLAQQTQFLDQHPLVGMVHSGWKLIDEEGKPLGEVSPWHSAPVLDLEAWLWKKPIKMGAMMYRKHWLRHINGFDPELRQSQDTDLLLRLALAGCTAEWIHQPTMAYRKYATSTIRRNAPAQYQYMLRVQEKAFAHPNMPEKLKEKQERSRYFSLRWVAWHIFSTGFPDAALEPLQDTAEHSPYDERDTLFDWLAYFGEHLLNVQRPLSDLDLIKPTLKQVIALPETDWQIIERFLPTFLADFRLGEKIKSPHMCWWFWKTAVAEEKATALNAEQLYHYWLHIWRPFFHENKEVVGVLEKPEVALAPEIFAAMGRICIVQRVDAYSLVAITAFWEHAVGEKWVPAIYRAGLVSWQLTLFGQLAVRKQWLLAGGAFGTAFKNSVLAPRSFSAWGNFIKTAVRYYQGQRQTS